MATAEKSPKTSQEAFEQAVEKRLRRKHADPEAAPTASEIREGLPYQQLDDLAERLGLTQDLITRVLGISERTLQRRKTSGRLSPSESDRFGRLVRIYRLALRAFDRDTDEARYWLTTPKRAFEGESPVEHLDTDPGRQAVEEMLIVIDQTMPA